MKRTGPRTEPCGTPQVRGDEGELCGRIPTVDVRDERYEVNHCSETEECVCVCVCVSVCVYGIYIYIYIYIYIQKIVQRPKTHHNLSILLQSSAATAVTDEICIKSIP